MSEIKKVEIAYITDSNYVLPTRVSITSLIKNSSDSHKYNIHVVGDGLKEGEIKELEELSSMKENVCVEVIKAENDYGELYTEHQHVSKAALLKFSLADIFDGLDKILYLDGDTLVLGDIAELFDTDISGYYGAAVCDAPTVLGQKSNERIGHSNYFNSGVMLLDLLKWRSDDIKSSLITEKENDEWGFFVDQDALNIVLGEKVRYLPLKYNCIYGWVINRSAEQIAGLFQISIDDARKQMENPVVLHLADKKKPWNNIGAAKFEEWMNYCETLLDNNTLLQLTRNYIRSQKEEISIEMCNLKLINDDLKIRIEELNNTIAYYRDRTLYGVLAKLKRKIFG